MNESKRQLRKRLRRDRRALSSGLICANNRAIQTALIESPELADVQTIAAYLASDGEPNLAPALAAFQARGQAVVLPWLPADRSQMTFRRFVPGTLITGPYGLLQPSDRCPSVEARDIDAFLVPLVAADLNGHRLGMGGGYYDRTLATANGQRIGIAHQLQVLDALPIEDHDQPLDALVTERGWIDTLARQAESEED